MALDIIDFNARWLKAWSDKNVAELVMFYSADTHYCDPSVPDGLKGREALRAYLTKLFAETPPMNYVPHETWATHNAMPDAGIAQSACPTDQRPLCAALISLCLMAMKSHSTKSMSIR